MGTATTSISSTFPDGVADASALELSVTPLSQTTAGVGAVHYAPRVTIPDWPDAAASRSPWLDIDGPTLLAVAAALQLRPENAHALLRFGRLAGVAATLPARPSARRLSSSAVRRLLSLNEVGGPMVAAMEDPYEGLFCLEVPFFTGPKLAVQGQATHGGKVVEALLTTIFRSPEGTFPDGFVLRVRTLAALILRTSDTVCRRAGLTRLNAAPATPAAVSVPAAEVFTTMAGWVRFDVADVFGRYPEPARDYLEDLLVRQQGATSVGELDELLILKPFVQNGSTLTVGAPADLMATLRHHIIVDAHRSGCADILGRQLHEFAVDYSQDLLSGMVDEPFQVADGGEGWSLMSAPFDGDKTLDLVVVSDNVDGYDGQSPFGEWFGQTAFDEAMVAADRSGASGRHLRLVVSQGVGRDLAAGFSSVDEHVAALFLSMTDLETLLQTPGTDGLSLWYFAEASTRLHERAQVIAFSTVDLWSTYLDRQSSFYLSDDALPSAVFIEVAAGQDLRVANARTLDRRHLTHPRTRTVCEAYSMHGPDASAVYIVRGSGGVSFFTDLGALEGWIHMVPSGAIPGVAAGALFDVGEATAYWLWQIALHCPEVVEGGAVDGVLEVAVRVGTRDDDSGPWVVSHPLVDGTAGLEVVGPPVVDGDDTPNAADRALVRALLSAIGAEGADAIVDAVAPAGIKRMMHAFGSTDDPLAWPGRLSDAWHLEDAAVAQVLDELGDHLTADHAMSVGYIPDERRTSVLNGVVTRWLIDRLTALLGDLSSDGLIGRLIDRNEALVSANAREGIHLPARIACFGPASDQVEKIEKNQRSANSSMLASRFLIEYTSAFPPRGDKPLTREVYNRALALASEIIHKGMLSDSLQHGLSTTRLSVLPSGRLGTDRDGDAYVAAIDAYGRARAESTFQGETGTTLTSAIDRDQADMLAEQEFGFSYRDLAAAVQALLSMMDDADHADVLTLTFEDLRADLTRRLRWGGDKVVQLISELSLRPDGGSVEEFWGQGISVRPWRFSRNRSYLRRPIVQWESDSETMASFGRRALWHAVPYWVHQFTSGRLQATTPQMRSALSRRQKEKGDEYEQLTLEELQRLGYSHLRRRVRRIGPHDFRNIDGENLGDVDVAAVRLNRRELLLLEVKDLEVARTPAELANEVNNLVGPGNSAVRRLAQRADWITRHLDMTLQELAVEDRSGRWYVRPLVVVNEPLLSERLVVSEIPIVSRGVFSEHLNGSTVPGRSSRNRRHSPTPR